MNREFEEKVKGAFGKTGEEWLSQLPEKLMMICKEWGLTIEGEPSNLSYNYVAFVRDETNQSLVLKVGIPGYDFSNEIQATREFQGDGFVRLHKFDDKLGSILLDRLEPGRTLKTVDKQHQIGIYLDLWNRINRQPSLELPHIHNWFNALLNPFENDLITKEQIETALRYKKEIEDTSVENVHLHGDLHQDNILFDEEMGWLAIDPKGVQGDAYFDYISFLFNDLNGDLDLLEIRVRYIAKKQGLDEQRLRKAAVALLTVQVLWALEDGAEDVKEMYEVLKYLSEEYQVRKQF